MRVLGLDFETTGLDTANDRIIEYAAVLWDTDKKTYLLAADGFINPHSPNTLTNFLTPEIIKITGITDELLNEFGGTTEEALNVIQGMSECADFIVAHNGNGFDKPILASECARLERPFPSIHWIDTNEDIDYPEHMKTRRLGHLAAEHGFLNPFAHRAMCDVLTMLKLFSMYDAEEVARVSMIASIEIRAKVNYDNRLEASSRGYRWDGARKFWIKRVKEHKLPEEIKSCPFEIEVLAR